MANNPPPTPQLTRLIKRLYILMNQHIDEILKRHDMARSQFQVLFHVHKASELTQKELQGMMQVEPATLSGLTDVLERKGWLERAAHPVDGRAKLLRLTAAGERTLHNIPNPAVKVEARMLRGIPARDKSVLKTSLEKMIQNLEDNK